MILKNFYFHQESKEEPEMRTQRTLRKKEREMLYNGLELRDCGKL